jgi:hypothetical protein
MKSKFLFWLLTTVLLTTASLGEAREATRIRWIGYLAGSGSAPNQAFVQGMRDLDYIEGKIVQFRLRSGFPSVV